MKRIQEPYSNRLDKMNISMEVASNKRDYSQEKTIKLLISRIAELKSVSQLYILQSDFFQKNSFVFLSSKQIEDIKSYIELTWSNPILCQSDCYFIAEDIANKILLLRFYDRKQEHQFPRSAKFYSVSKTCYYI